ncbi:MAG: M14 family zinc carboxypeptidase [Stagnimonas sp.]|nr:M14 family zinc carboxypeptidase [Stagnimonas sp.]
MAALKPLRLALLAAGLPLVAAQAAELRFTQNTSAATSIALGYPVPLPVDSQTPVDGFRGYAALEARLQDLALGSDYLSRQSLGNSFRGRAIPIYLASDDDALTAEGFPEPAALLNGGIHAREWASPEVVTGIVERLSDKASTPGLERYLLENLKLLVIPVLNVDGFLQTQRYPDRSLQTEFAGDPQNENYPRDGRMQRKNMRDKDELLCAADDPGCAVRDGMAGVDLNRNNTPFRASSTQSSGNPASLVYHGTAAASEPEVQALQAAAALGPAARLRMYIDFHSFSRIYFGADTGNARRDALQRSLATAMRAVNGNAYGYDPTPPGVGIGSTDEHFAYTHQIPAYTLEIEPGPNGSSQYGGFGYSHDGFVLPASEIARVRGELADATLLGLYRQAGPPSLRAVEIRERDSGTPVFEARWQQSDAGHRQLLVTTRAPLRAEVDYRLWLAFNKPMRARDGGGAVANYRGQSVALAPSIRVEGLDRAGASFSQTLSAPVTGWRSSVGAVPAALHYGDDAYLTEFRLPTATPLAGARRINLRLDVADLSGQRLDADPASAVDWSGGAWSGYQGSDGSAGDVGGEDRSLRLVDDGSPLFGAGADSGPSGGGGAPSLPALLGLALAGWARRGWGARR